jgi:hypothetical protein
MNDYWVRLRFENAKLPYYDKVRMLGSFDIVYNKYTGEKGKRDKCSPDSILWYDMKDMDKVEGNILYPFTLHTASNMYAVMLQEKPVSKFHGPEGVKRNTDIDEMVLDGFVGLYAPYFHTCKTGLKRPNTEVVKWSYGHFANYNATNNDSTISNNSIDTVYWEQFDMRYLRCNAKKQAAMDGLVSLLSEITGRNAREYATLTFAISAAMRVNAVKVMEYLKNANLLNFVNGTTYRSELTGPFIKTEKGYPQKVIILNGEFIFKLNEEYVEQFITGMQTARFLEGGIVDALKWSEYGVDDVLLPYDLLSEDQIESYGYCSMRDVCTDVPTFNNEVFDKLNETIKHDS